MAYLHPLIHSEQQIDHINIYKMKYLFVLTVGVISLCCSSIFAQDSKNPLSSEERFVDYVKRTYTLSQDSIDATLNIFIYSKTVIEYNLCIISPYKKIEQKGYALNLADSSLEGGFEYELDEYGKELRVIPYQSWHCSCEQEFDLEIRIALDESKVSIYSSQKLRSELLNELVVNQELSNRIVPLIGYLYRQ